MPTKTLTALLLPLAFAMVFSACKKHDDAKPSKPSYTAKMGGIRNWRGYHDYSASGMHYTTPVHEYYTFPEASFALEIVDDTTVNYQGAPYKLEKADSASKIYFFGRASEFNEYHMGNGIMYYYEKDSIVYCNGDRHATSDSWELTELYYTY